MAKGVEAAGQPRRTGSEGNGSRWVVLGVCFATLVALSPALAPGAGFAWDDRVLIRDNPLMESSAGVWTLLTGGFWQGAELDNDYYRPLVSLSYWLERRVFGAEALGHHWVNVFLHLACVVLAARWLVRRVPLAGVPRAAALAWLTLALAVFALHPSRPESVAWISGRTDVLALLLSLLGFEAFAAGSRLRTGLCAVSLVAATLCKETAVTLLLPWLLDPWLLAARRGPRRLDVGQLVVCGVVALAFVVRMALVPSMARPLGDPSAVFAALGLYLREVVAPFPPSAIVAPLAFDAGGQARHAPAWVALGAIAALALVALGARALRRPSARPWLADTLWFLCPLLPVLQGVSLQLAGHVAERFLYMPLLGVCALLLRAGVAWSRSRAPSPRLLWAVAVVWPLLYLPFSFAFARAYRSDPELWAYELAVNPARVEVLAQVLHALPREDLPTQREVARDLFRVALADHRHDAVVEAALHLVEAHARTLPRGDCLAALQPLDALREGDVMRLGPPDDLAEVRLPAQIAAPLLEERTTYWAQRARLLLRCGRARQALRWLDAAPPGGAVDAMRIRATALAGGLQAGEEVAEHARAHRPLDRHVRRAWDDLQRARALTSSPGWGFARAEVVEARVAMALGDLWSAQTQLEQATALRADAHYLSARIELELRAHRVEGAARALQQARLQRPDLSSYWDTLAALDAVSGAPDDFPQPPE